MAKKVLNKKVALIGSVVFAFMVLGAIAAVLYLNRDPGRFVREGDDALVAAREAADEAKREEEYKAAERSYSEAYGLAKTDGEKVEVLFRLADLYIEKEGWRDVRNVWNNIIRIQPDNVRARFGRLKYVYVMADSGLGQAWNEVSSQATDLLEVAEGSNLLGEDTSQWDPFAPREEGSGAKSRLGPYLYLVRGRANFEIARTGASTDRERLLAESMEDLKKVRELEPSSVEACQYMAFAILSRGEIVYAKGDFRAKEAAAEEAQRYLKGAMDVIGENATLEVMLLSIRLSAAQRSEADFVQDNVMSLESEYSLLMEKFPSSAEAFSASANFYRMSLANLDKAIGAGERAMELAAGDVYYVRSAASLYYSRYCMYGSQADFDKAVGLAKDALELPDAQDKPGPRQWANRMNRVLLFTFLAECYIEQVLEPRVAIRDVERESLLVEAEEVVRRIKELLGTGDAPQVVKWQGLLELARGDRNAAVKDMYNAYEQFKSVGRKDSLLSYRLAKVFENTSEIGATKEFFESALRRPDRVDERKPYALLDYAEVLLRLGDYNGTLSVADFFERKYWGDARSKQTRMRAYIQGGQFKEVEEELAKGNPDDPNTIKLRVLLLTAKIRQGQRAISRQRMQESSPTVLQELEAPEETGTVPEGSVQALTDELRTYWRELASSLEELLTSEPNSVRETSIVAVCNNYVAEGKAASATALVDKFLEHFPDNTTALFYKSLLSEAERGKVSQERRKVIEGQVLSQITDPVQRAINLGKHYRRYNEPSKAVAEFQKVFDIGAFGDGTRNDVGIQREEPNDIHRLAASYLFEIAILQKDWSLASKIQRAAERQDIDQCEGNFFAARLATARAAGTDNEQLKKEDNNAALSSINRCLGQRPVFSHGFLLRSSIEMALGDEESALADARKAATLNPLDGSVARNLAFVLYKRNEGLGTNVTTEQEIETKNALVQALRTNPGDLQLLSFYAEYISPSESAKALAIRQHLQKAVPSVQNALLLGRLAMRMAGDEMNAETKGALLEIASSSFDEAMALAPEDRRVLEAKAAYYRFIGEAAKATDLLSEAGSDELLWVHYLGLNRFEEAKGILDGMYAREPEDVNVLRGLLAVAEQTRDEDGIRRYSSELLSAEDTIQNRLLQIQTFLRSGLIREAESSLGRFKDRHPDEPRSLLLEAWLAMRQGRLEDALETTNRSLQMDREDAAAWRIRGQINSLLARTDQAIDDLKRSKSLSDLPGTRYYLSRAYLQAGRVEDAITELDSAITSSESIVEGELIGRAPRELLEQIYLRHGKKAALRRFYEETLERFSGDVSWHNRAATFALSEGNFSRAEQLYKRAADLCQSKEKAGKGNIDKDEFHRSLDGYLRVLVLQAGSPNTPRWNPAELNRVFEEGGRYVGGEYAPVAYYRMAEAKMHLGDRAGAVEYCRSALRKAYEGGGDEALASRILRGMYTLLGADEVVKYCREKLGTEPNSVAANLAMFGVMKLKGEYNKALSHIDRCLESVGQEDPRRLNFVVNKVSVLTLAYYRTSDNSYLDKAVTEYESLLKEMPNNTVVMNNLAYLLAESGEKLAEALQYAAHACELSPNNAGLMDTYAYVLHKNGKNSEADKLLQAAIQLYGQDEAIVPAVVYEHLGMIKEGLGSRTEALASYKLALDSGGDDLSDSTRIRISSAIKRLSGSGER